MLLSSMILACIPKSHPDAWLLSSRSSATNLRSFALSQNGHLCFQPFPHSFALLRGEGVHHLCPSLNLQTPMIKNHSAIVSRRPSAILILRSSHRTGSLFHPSTQGAPCSRFG